MYPSNLQCSGAEVILPGSKVFDEELSFFVDNAEKNNRSLTLSLLDIDNLCYINDLSGRKTGDEIINTTAAVLSGRGSDTIHVYRLEGNLFAVIAEGISRKSFVTGLCESIFIELGRYGISISMGVALFPDHDKSALSLYRDADLALRYVKTRFKGNYCIYNSRMYTSFLNELQIQKFMSDSLEKKEFILYYQPQFYIENHKLRGFEALIRRYDEVNGLQKPDTFIPAAEKTNLIGRIGIWVMENAVKNLVELKDQYDFDGMISINVSPRQLLSPLFLTQVKSLLRQYKVNPAQLEIEITESSFINDTARAAAVLNGLKKTGVKISIDDFGIGYSSLCNLCSMPVDTIKIDKSFIDTILKNNNMNNEIIKAVIEISQKAGIETIAEGVETSEQLDFLTSVSCSCIQGFIWGKPMPLADCLTYL
jgi:diguanylate cyclase (GGDEF)-like protein